MPQIQSKKARHILELSSTQKKEFLNSFDVIFSDCDGVVWMVIGPIPGTGESINLLKDAGKKVKFVSNNSVRTDADYVRKFKDIGVKDVQKEDIVHPVKTIAKYLQKTNKDKRVFTIADPNFDEYLRGNGFEISSMNNETEMYTPQTFVEKIPPRDKVGAVVVDIDLNFTVAKICRAQQHLLDPECEFIVGGSDKFIPMTKNLTVIGPDGFIQILSEATGRKPTILGKPGKLLGEHLIETFKIENPGRALFIGDALVQDIQFGQSCGFQTLFVLSGATTKDEMLSCPEDLKPDYYANSLADFIDFFRDL